MKTHSDPAHTAYFIGLGFGGLIVLCVVVLLYQIMYKEAKKMRNPHGKRSQHIEQKITEASLTRGF